MKITPHIQGKERRLEGWAAVSLGKEPEARAEAGRVWQWDETTQRKGAEQDWQDPMEF